MAVNKIIKSPNAGRFTRARVKTEQCCIPFHGSNKLHHFVTLAELVVFNFAKSGLLVPLEIRTALMFNSDCIETEECFRVRHQCCNSRA